MGYIGALSLNGGEMQGVLKLQAGQYGGTGPSDEKYGLDCQNSNIIGVNRILSADPAEAPSEGWGFKRSDDPDKYDVIWAADGKLYFTPGFKYNTPPYPSNYTVLHSGGGAVNGRLQFTTTQYPQIYGNGVLQFGGNNKDEYGVVIQSNRSDDQNSFRPAVNAGTAGHMYLGSANQKWRAVYAQNGAIQTSDRNAKHDITDLDPDNGVYYEAEAKLLCV